MAVRTAKVWTALEAATAANLNKSPGGWIGYAKNTVDQTGITGTDQALSSVTCTPTVGTSRLIKVSGTAVVTATGTCTYYITIMQDAVSIGRIARVQAVATGDVQFHSGFSYVVAPSAGAHIYSLSITLSSGTSLTVDGTGGTAARILVEDLGSTT